MAQPHFDQPKLNEKFRQSPTVERNPVVSRYNDPNEKTIYDRNGVSIRNRYVTLEDGAEYEIVYSKINRNVDIGRQGIASYASTAWTTRPHGLYVHQLIVNASNNIEGHVIGSPENRGRMFNPTENGRNLLEIAAWHAPYLDRDPHHVLSEGISQGFINGVAFADQAEAYDMEVMAADYRAAALPDGVSKKLLKEAPTKIMNEVTEIADIISHPVGRLVHFVKTLDVTKRGLYTHIQAVKGLVSGQPGQHMRNLPASTFGHFSASSGDFMSDHETVNSIASSYDFMSTSNGGKSHLDDVLGSGYTAARERMKTISHIFAENQNLRSLPIDVMRKQLYHLACEQNPQFIKKSD